MVKIVPTMRLLTQALAFVLFYLGFYHFLNRDFSTSASFFKDTTVFFILAYILLELEKSNKKG